MPFFFINICQSFLSPFITSFVVYSWFSFDRLYTRIRKNITYSTPFEMTIAYEEYMIFKHVEDKGTYLCLISYFMISSNF